MSAPLCPACSRKFPFAQADNCPGCNLPRNVATQGSEAIKRWKQGKTLLPDQPSREFKHGRAGSKTRRRNKHGRQHAAR